MRLLVEHPWWTNRRLLDAPAGIPEERWGTTDHVAAGASPGDTGFLEDIGESHRGR